MKNLKKVAFNVLSSTALLATAVVPVAAVVAPAATFAAGSGSLAATNVPALSNTSSTPVALGSVKVVIPQYTLSGTDNTVTLTLPQGIKFSGGFNTVSNNVYVSNAGGSNVALGQLAATQLGDNQVQITLPAGTTTNNSDDLVLMVNLGSVTVSGASNGAQKVNFAAPSDSSFPVGDVTVGNIQSNGTVDLAATDTTSGSSSFTFNLGVTEEIANSLKTGSNSLKLKLPSGYVWNTTSFPTAAQGASQLYGDASGLANYSLSSNGDTLTITALNATQKATALKIPLSFSVNDSDQVKAGPVNVYISGTSTVNVSTLQVGSYGDYSASVTAASTPSILAGKSQQTIGDLTIKESVPGTFVAGRTIELQLPDTARWEDVFENAVANNGTPVVPANGWAPTLNISYTNGLNAQATFSGTDYRTLKLTFQGNGSLGNTDPGEIDLKNVQIATAANANGDVNLTVGGTSGVTGTVKVASAAAPATVAVSNVTTVQPGQSGQAVGDITVTESKAGAFDKDYVGNSANNAQVALKLDASGAQWDAAPTVTVTSGDASVNNVYTSGQYLYFTLNSTSGAAPATFKVSGGTIKLDNTTPVGDIPVKLQGQAVDYAANKVTAWSNNTTTAAKATVAHVATGLFGQSGSVVKFTEGQTTYTVNGTQKTLDVAPYTDGGRTYLPIRYVAESVGVTDDNIIWDNNTKTVTLIKGSRVVSFTVGQNYYTLNGTKVAMDGAAQFKAGRNMIPLRYAAQALGASVSWDDATQTATIQ